MKHKRSLMSIAMATIMLVSLCAVCASTSVSAADGGSNRASVQAAPDLVGAPIAPGTGPAVCTQGDRSIDLFVKGADGALWWKHWTYPGSWSAWKSLGGKLTSSPVAISRWAGALEVFGRGGDGACWTKWSADGGGTWSNWANAGGKLLEGTGPAACAWGMAGDGWTVFVTGTNHALWHKSWTSSGGTVEWKSLGGYLTSSPAAYSSSLGWASVFVRGGDGARYQKFTVNGGSVWTEWYKYPAFIAEGTGPGACSFGYDTGAVVVQGRDHTVYYQSHQNGENWSGWENLGGKLTSSPAIVATTNPVGGMTMNVVVRGTDGNLWWKYRVISSWSPWISISGP